MGNIVNTKQLEKENPLFITPYLTASPPIFFKTSAHPFWSLTLNFM